jgi:universal stress protein E
MHYLTRLKESGVFRDVPVSVEASCESPLYQGIVHKVYACMPALVIKNAGDTEHKRPRFDDNDWQLMRACPATLMLTRGRRWRQKPRLAAAVDMSTEDATLIAFSILRHAELLRRACGGELDVVYVDETSAEPSAAQEHKAAMARLIEGLSLQESDVHLLAGEPERALPRFAAQQDYDVLVLGALTSRKSLAAAVGSLTSRLVDALECDFLLVKPGASDVDKRTNRRRDAGAADAAPRATQ